MAWKTALKFWEVELPTLSSWHIVLKLERRLKVRAIHPCLILALTLVIAAVDRIIDQSASEILKIFILGTDSVTPQWTREQAWHIIKSLAHSQDGTLLYNKVLLSDLFKGDGEAALRALEQAELISVGFDKGFPRCIKPGKPVYRAAFQRLIENKTLEGRLDLLILAQLISNENKSIGKYEEELQLLGSLPKQPRELIPRIEWLLNKVRNSQARITRYEHESSVLQKGLQSAK